MANRQSTPTPVNTTVARPKTGSQFGHDYDYANFDKFKQGGFNVRKSQTKDRKITANRPDPALPDNSVHTNKYSVITFIPKFLFEQYTKPANLYFLLLGVLQIIPYTTNSDQQPTIWLPLFIINIATGIKDLYEDRKRKIQDSEENNAQTNILTTVGDTQVNWSTLMVGNLVKVDKNQFFPCDLLILNTSEPKGVCYIETKNLDGETNLKQKNAHKDIYSIYKGEQYFENNVIFDYERPNAFLYKFNGRVTTKENEKLSIDANNFILRGCSLRNTKWVVGLVAYTGHDTKLMMNSFSARAKRSHLESSMNSNIVIVFLVMCFISLFGSLYFVISNNKNENSTEYLETEDMNGAAEFFINFFSWILNLSNLVPISLLVTLELVKMTQGIFITRDPGMIYLQTQTPTQVQSSNLNEELGQVEYIFSDKTGTLTCNIMEFKKMSINGVSYGEVKKGQSNYQEDISGYPKVTNVDFRDKTFFDALSNSNHPEYPYIVKTLFVLALCHTIITEKQDKELVFNASSPDELALINLARFVGVCYLGMDEQNNMEVKYKNQVFRYTLLHVLEFNSTRKRMSVILRDEKGGIQLYTKGADSIILDRTDRAKSKFVPETVNNLAEYGRIGLRTLLLAEKQIDRTYFEDWNTRYMEACSSMEKRDDKMDALQEELETNLVVVGATAIEDKLQDQVGETIDALMKQGIHVWVLTGDKIETAINIGISCKLITQDMQQIIVDEKEEVKLIQALENALILIHQADNINAAFIISGDALLHGLKGNISKQQSIVQQYIGESVKSVLCCRVSPKQKQEVVSLVRKEKPTVVTLAIGDGANDVNMITAAHVGVGIKGLEGAQAARASDYAIGEFKLLRRLLFYHGRECYRRNCNLILYNFFKNVLLVMPQFWFGVYNFFSGPTFYDNYTYQFFNVFFASWPIMVYSIFDQEEPANNLVKNQMKYYDIGMYSTLFNKKIFWLWFLDATIQSILIVFFAFQSCEATFDSVSGQTLTFWTSGMMILGMVVVISNFKVMIICTDYSIGLLSISTLSVIIYLIALLMSTNIQYGPGQVYNDLQPVMTSGYVHLGNVLILGSTSLMDMAIEWSQRWKMKSQQKENYLKRLEKDLLQKDDLIIFTPITITPKKELPYFDGSITENFSQQQPLVDRKIKVNFLHNNPTASYQNS